MSDHHHDHDHDHGHDHGHSHGHDHKVRGPAFGIALAITAGYAVVELAGGMWTGSLALVSDAGHMFSDALSLGLAAIAAHLAQRPVGHRHTYGWARAEVIGALVNSLLMLAIIFVLVAEAIVRLREPAPVAAGGMIVIALIGMAVNVAVAWFMSHGHGTMTLGARAALLHVLGDLLSSFAAVIAGGIIYVTGWLPIDPILSLVIAGLILASTLRLLRDTLHVLMEGVPATLDLPAIGRAIAGIPGVIAVHDLHVWSIASERVALSAHVELKEIRQWPEILAAAGELLRKHYGIEHITLQPEVRAPDSGQTAVIRMWPRGHRPRT